MNCPSRHGYSLTEMLFVIALLSVVFLLEARLFTASMRIIGDAPKTQAEQASLEQMCATLRRDVWSASSIDVPDDRTILLTDPAGATIRWELADHSVKRGERQWPVAIPIRAVKNGAAVNLQSVSGQADVAAERQFVSQILLARGSP